MSYTDYSRKVYLDSSNTPIDSSQVMNQWGNVFTEIVQNTYKTPVKLVVFKCGTNELANKVRLILNDYIELITQTKIDSLQNHQIHYLEMFSDNLNVPHFILNLIAQGMGLTQAASDNYVCSLNIVPIAKKHLPASIVGVNPKVDIPALQREVIELKNQQSEILKHVNELKGLMKQMKLQLDTVLDLKIRN